MDFLSSGMYRCVAENGAGMVEEDIKVNVLCKFFFQTIFG